MEISLDNILRIAPLVIALLALYIASVKKGIIDEKNISVLQAQAEENKNLNNRVSSLEKDVIYVKLELEEHKKMNIAIIQIKDAITDMRVSVAVIKKHIELTDKTK